MRSAVSDGSEETKEVTKRSWGVNAKGELSGQLWTLSPVPSPV